MLVNQGNYPNGDVQLKIDNYFIIAMFISVEHLVLYNVHGYTLS